MRAISDRSLSLSMRCYRGLLRAYPTAFLADFEDLLVQAFGDLAHRALRTKGVWGLFVLWMRTVPDLISSAFNQRFQTTSRWNFRLRWIGACTASVAIVALLIFGPGFLIFEIKMWLGMLSHHTPGLIRVQPKPRIQARLLLDAALLGLFLGSFQSLALRLRRFRRAAWIAATILGVTLSASVLILVPFVATYLRVNIHPWRLMLDHHQGLYYGGSAVLCVGILGMLQTLVLTGRNVRALVWIPATAIGIVACDIVATFTPSLPFVGFVYGLLTVLPLEWILQPAVGAVYDRARLTIDTKSD